MNGPKYIICRWEYGWTVESAHDSRGIPACALNEILPIFPNSAVINSGIAHHLRFTTRPSVTLCITEQSDGALWEKEITERLATRPPQEQWWKGVDTGTSSAAIFAVFCDSQWRKLAIDYARDSIPHDAADLGRCLRLLEKFPEWNARLQEVAQAYPKTTWPAIIAHWKTLTTATPTDRTALLRKLNTTPAT
jgi:hypothetical protein